MIERIRKRFNSSVSETASHDLWGNATIGVAVVASTRTDAESICRAIIEFAELLPDLELTTFCNEIVAI